jgi:hypothetical protein
VTPTERRVVLAVAVALIAAPVVLVMIWSLVNYGRV